MPGPRSRTVSSPSRRRTSIGAPGGLHFAALSSRFATARSSRDGHALDERRLELGGEVTPGAWRRARSTAARDQPVEPHVLDRGRVGLLVAGELDEVADERGQLLELRDHVGAQPLAVAGVRRPAAGQHLEVRAQRGERRAQLVRGVGDELALRALRALERLEHGVEGAREPRDLVVAVRLDPAREVARGGDVLGGRRSAPRPAASRCGWRAARAATASAIPASASPPSAQRSVPSASSTSVSGRAANTASPFGAGAHVTRARARRRSSRSAKNGALRPPPRR